MATIEATRSDRPVGLGASTLCEALQLTAEEHPERVALRTKGGEFEGTWGDYAQKVKRLAAGFAALGLQRGQTLGIMLTNFFFQAEDGIRDLTVTGVQTCALPI